MYPAPGMTTAAWWGTGCDVSLVAGFIALTIAAFVTFRSGPSPFGRPLFALSLGLLLIPLISVGFGARENISLIVHSEIQDTILLLYAGSAIGIVATFVIARAWPGPCKPLAVCIGFGLVGALMFGLGVEKGITAAKDLWVPRDVVVGVVDRLERHRGGGRHFSPGRIEIQGRTFYMSTEVEEGLFAGMRVHLEAGAGSHYILAIEALL